MVAKKKGLGKGLDSLIPDNKPVKKTVSTNTASVSEKTELNAGEQMMKISMVEPNREQPVKSLRRMLCSNCQILLSSLGFFNRCL